MRAYFFLGAILSWGALSASCGVSPESNSNVRAWDGEDKNVSLCAVQSNTAGEAEATDGLEPCPDQVSQMAKQWLQDVEKTKGQPSAGTLYTCFIDDKNEYVVRGVGFLAPLLNFGAELLEACGIKNEAWFENGP